MPGSKASAADPVTRHRPAIATKLAQRPSMRTGIVHALAENHAETALDLGVAGLLEGRKRAVMVEMDLALEA